MDTMTCYAIIATMNEYEQRISIFRNIAEQFEDLNARSHKGS